MRLKKPRKKLKPWVIPAIIAVAILVAILVYVRIRNRSKQQENEPVKSGTSYEAYDSDKALDVVTRYFEGIKDKDMEALQGVFFTDDVLTTFAKYNEVTTTQVIQNIKDSLDDLSLEYKELKIVDYSAYRDNYVEVYNNQIEDSTGKKNVISNMYAVGAEYYQYTTIGWEQKDETLIVYVCDGNYYIWPNTAASEE